MLNTKNDMVQFNKPLVSVIVPVYNVERFIHRCVESLIGQSYKNMEIILVDDGSSDNSGKICDDYANNHSFIYVIHQKNAGQAAARNNAIKCAKGTFVSFVDSDDYVEPDYIEYLLLLQQKFKADVAIGGFTYLYDNKKKYRKRRPSLEKIEVLNASEALIKMNYTEGFGATPWAKLYKKQLVENHPFPEGQIYEDLATLYKIIGDCNRIVYGNKKIYYWVQRTGSTMRMPFNEKQLAGITAASEQLCYLEMHFPEAVQAGKVRYMAKIVEIMALAIEKTDSKKNYKKLKIKMLYYEDVMFDKRASLTLKFRLKSIFLGYLPTRLCFIIHERMKRCLI